MTPTMAYSTPLRRMVRARISSTPLNRESPQLVAQDGNRRTALVSGARAVTARGTDAEDRKQIRGDA
jgi:hypothetical protein